MLRVGLTGGVACGKSTVAHMLAARGARLIDADQIARELLRPGEPIYYKVVNHFGPGIVDIAGAIDRAKLAELAFSGGRVQELNEIVHPAVIARQEEWMRGVAAENPRALVIVEAALILEAGVGKRFDKLIVVTCRPEQRSERFAARQGVDLAEAREEVERRMQAQWPDERKVAAADYVIDNSGPVEQTEQRVAEIFAELKRLAEARAAAEPQSTRRNTEENES